MRNISAASYSWTVFAVSVFLAAGIGKAAAAIISTDVEKQITLFPLTGSRFFPFPPASKAIVTWGENRAREDDLTPKIVGPEAQTLSLNTTGVTLSLTERASAVSGDAQAKVTIGVGQAQTDPSGAIVAVTGTIAVHTQYNNSVSSLVKAVGNIDLDVGAVVDVNQLTVNGKILTQPKEIKDELNRLKLRNIILDPLHLTILDNVTGATVVDSDVFTFELDSSPGASVGLNSSGLLNLSLIDDPTFDATASLSSQTLVPWATNLDGSASLSDGVFTASGIFGDLSQWVLSRSAVPGYSDFIIEATFLGDPETIFGLDFAAPVPSSTDIYTLEVSSNLQVSAASVVPEPASSCLILTGLTVMAISWAFHPSRGRYNTWPQRNSDAPTGSSRSKRAATRR